jgi:hypothetical protein
MSKNNRRTHRNSGLSANPLRRLFQWLGPVGFGMVIFREALGGTPVQHKSKQMCYHEEVA